MVKHSSGHDLGEFGMALTDTPPGAGQSSRPAVRVLSVAQMGQAQTAGVHVRQRLTEMIPAGEDEPVKVYSVREVEGLLDAFEGAGEEATFVFVCEDHKLPGRGKLTALCSSPDKGSPPAAGTLPPVRSHWDPKSTCLGSFTSWCADFEVWRSAGGRRRTSTSTPSVNRRRGRARGLRRGQFGESAPECKRARRVENTTL